MRENHDTVIVGERVLLVPYKPEHVPRYHEWMKDPALQESTASEPLSLEEEYDMQRAWATDPDKLTFIVLDRSLPDTAGTGCQGGAMAGDVNLFFTIEDEGRAAAEIEVMVAEPGSRGKGLAKEALRMLMAYACKELGVQRYVAKIHEVNGASRQLFEKVLGFKEFNRVACFGEVHYQLHCGDPRVREWMEPMQAGLQCRSYEQGPRAEAGAGVGAGAGTVAGGSG